MMPNVFVIDGRMGSGKTHFANAWLGSSKNTFFAGFPKSRDEVMEVGDVFSVYDTVVVDELMGFEKTSAKVTIDRLISEATETDKRLIMLVQDLETFKDIGIDLPKNTAYATAKGIPANELEFKFTVTI